jgi:hypothetical protein
VEQKTLGLLNPKKMEPSIYTMNPLGISVWREVAGGERVRKFFGYVWGGKGVARE